RDIGVIDARDTTARPGAQGALHPHPRRGEVGSPDERHRALASAAYARQTAGLPGHEWALAEPGENMDWRHSFRTVSQIMSRDLFTLHPEDVVDLAASLMDWEHVHHVPVEDDDGKLVGLMTQRIFLRLIAKRSGRRAGESKPLAVGEVMVKEPVTIGPRATTLEAIELMRDQKVGCLPVVEEGRLVGIVTEHDFVDAAAKLLEERLRDG
ncbi:MAG: CBS domain-containing protein, partial [Planctomycetota bacterium]